MKAMTYVVLGAGYAGIHAVKEILSTFKAEAEGPPPRIVLVDRNTYHLRKVLLFRPAATGENIMIPLTQLYPEGVELLQANATQIEAGTKQLLYLDSTGKKGVLSYDRLVVAAGSVVRQPEANQGGMPLATPEGAMAIREAWQRNLKLAVLETGAEERDRLMTIAIAGAGISGIETAAELAHYVREDARQFGLDPQTVRIMLYNSNHRLFPDGPSKVGEKLESSLEDKGVKVVHGSRVVQEKSGTLTLSSGEKRPAGLCIWTLGLLPNPRLHDIGLPVDPQGYVITDACYRVQGMQGVYSIGDCARIVDPSSGRVDGKTCKEAIAQAARLGKILWADFQGRRAPEHKGYIDFFCFGLGPKQGMVWTHKWGLDIIMTGKLGWRIRQYSWEMASLIIK
ncbi:pyridine nucleotide-disulfide oxidoreductase [Paenibacillus albidus]|uniref:Pyridine nucleotide-disulfide oxidoreductase n=1 Tax=Paenibacillus albidus TaxID=2041023 RepID=A0A917CA33_9BACL|nr:FAD-dependent oxidoreductase [Paenibacillus albidus]GGF79468.1 pyridine nucleotide-disulfide oxidoreductase [Paenibacillus albidus]